MQPYHKQSWMLPAPDSAQHLGKMKSICPSESLKADRQGEDEICSVQAVMLPAERAVEKKNRNYLSCARDISAFLLFVYFTKTLENVTFPETKEKLLASVYNVYIKQLQQIQACLYLLLLRRTQMHYPTLLPQPFPSPQLPWDEFVVSVLI